MHTYHIIEGICEDLDYNIKLMAGARDIHATFVIKRPMSSGKWGIMDGYCGGSEVILGATTTYRVKFDLHDPDSILKIKDYLMGNYFRTARR
jgi:hypothetical protein